MRWLLLSPLAMSYVPLVIQHLIILLYLFSIKGKSRLTWVLVLAFAGLTLSALTQLVAVAIFAPWARYIGKLPQVAVLFSLVALIQFAYHYPRTLNRTEARVVLTISMLVALTTSILWSANVFQGGAIFSFVRQLFTTDGESQTLSNIGLFTILLQFLWLPVVLLRQTLRAATYAGPLAPWLRRPERLISPAGLRYVLARLGADASKLLRPREQLARAPRAFALVLGAGIVGTLAAWFEAQGALPAGTAAGIILLIDFAFAIVYVDNAPEPSSFRVKLIGVSLVTLLVVLGLVNAATLARSDQDYDRQRLAEVAHVKTLLRLGALEDLPGEVAYILARPGARDLLSADLTLVYARDPGFDLAALQTETRRRYGELVDARAAGLREANPALSPDEARGQARAELETEGAAQVRHYRGERLQAGQQSLYYDLPLGDQRYEIGFRYLDYRAFIHDIAVYLAWIMLGTVLAILLIFPLFFQPSLFTPLTTLLRGVERVNAGDLRVEVPIHVEDEIGFLSRSFNSMVRSIAGASAELQAKNEALMRLDQLKDEFLANTSHELRTPLNGMIGIAESMVDGATGPLTQLQRYNLALITSSGRRLASLVNDILDFARLRHQELPLQRRPLSIHAVAELVLTLSQPLAAGRPLALENQISPDLPLVDADENRVQQILHNLVGNAIKFTAAGSVVLSAEVEGAALAIHVRDTGIGIPADKQARIFESFEQADGSVARAYGGTGLGLSISKQLAELHGGTIRVSSTPDQGSCFTFTLPLADPIDLALGPAHGGPETEAPPLPGQAVQIAGVRAGHEPGAGQAPALAEAPERYEPLLREGHDPESERTFTILVVDDEPVNLQVLNNHLSLQHYAVTQALHGQEALDLIERGLAPDLVILDVMMPRMSGYEVCQRLRERFPATELPVLMLTAKNQVTDLVEGFGSGANDYLTKPFSRSELLARIQTHLRLAKVNAAYGRFVPHEFLRFLGKENIVDVHLGDQVQLNMSVLFADIRSFTSLSERMTPQENFNFLNSYLRRVGPVIRTNRGFIDKFIGDALMALFPNEPDDALRAAVELRRELALYNAHRQQSGYEPIEIGIGLHCGLLMLGTVGEEQRMESTVISDVVNTASRLESLTKSYGADLIITAHALHSLHNPAPYHVRPLGRVRIKGKQEPLSIYEVCDGATAEQVALRASTLPLYEEALRHFEAGALPQASALFDQLLHLNPADRVAARFRQRAGGLVHAGQTSEDVEL